MLFELRQVGELQSRLGLRPFFHDNVHMVVVHECKGSCINCRK